MRSSAAQDDVTASQPTAWKRHRFGLAVIALLVAVFFAPALASRQVFTFRDHADYFQPLRYYTSIHLKSFQLPYWNPYSQSGEPWLANPQTGIFYLPTWLFAFLPFETAYMLYLAFHLALLGIGAYLLFARQVRPGAAVVGAVAVMFSGPVISLMDVSNNLATFAWVPLVMWSGLARVRPQIVAVLLAMTFLAGEPFFAAVAALLYAITVFAAARPIEALSDVAIAGAGAFGLSAIQLLPFLDMLRGSDRAAGLDRAEIFAESMPLRDWLRVATPPQFAWENQAWDPALSQHFIPVVYVGMLVTALAIVGIVSSLWSPPLRRLREHTSTSAGDSSRSADVGGQRMGTWRSALRSRHAGWLLLLIASALIAAGNTVPLVGEIFTHLPVTLFRYPSRVVAFGALAVAAFAAAGWDRLRPNRRWADLILLLLIIVDVVPREKPLFSLKQFAGEWLSYPATVGRTAKVARVVTQRFTNRSAWMAGYLNLYQRRFDAGTAAPVTSHSYMRLYETAVTRARLDLLDFIGVGFVLTNQELPGMPVVARSGPVTVYAKAGALPVATFWSAVRAHDRAEDALQAMIEEPKAAVLDVAPRFSGGSEAGAPQVTSASWAAVDSRHARVVLDAPADGVVMITQQDDPAWRVYVDGVEGKKLVGGGVFRAVAVRKGHHEVVWEYRSRALTSGLTMTLVTALTLVMSRFVKRSAA